VAEYVLCALARLSQQKQFDWRRCSVGIVGCGEVGSRLAGKLLALGLQVCIHDPFLSDAHPLAAHFCSLDKVLAQQVVSLHTPLTRDTAWPTWHLLDAGRLARLAPGSILINAARGAVVDNQALLELLERQPGPLVVLDAWEGEPAIEPALLARVTLGTPHIAGYTLQGKQEGTRLVAEAFARHFGSALTVQTAMGGEGELLAAPATGGSLGDLNALLLAAYDIERDHRALQALLPGQALSSGFDLLRKHYPVRQEFAAFTINPQHLPIEVAEQALALGFRVLS